MADTELDFLAQLPQEQPYIIFTAIVVCSAEQCFMSATIIGGRHRLRKNVANLAQSVEQLIRKNLPINVLKEGTDVWLTCSKERCW